MHVPSINWISKDPLHLWLQSDVHIGNKEFRKKLYLQYKKWFHDHEEQARTIWLGDIMEFNIPTHLPFAMRQQDKTVQEQWAIIEGKLREENPYLYIVGNHEFRIINNAFVYDPFERLCENLSIFYSRTAQFWELRVHRKSYLWYLSHGYGGSTLPFSHFKSLWRDGVLKDCNFVVMGHTHHNRWITHNSYRFGPRVKKMVLKKQYWIRSGSFLINPEYAARHKLKVEEVGNVIVSFVPKKTPIISHTLQDWKERFD